MDGSGRWLLRGERCLWTGRPVQARVTPADAGLALYLAVAVLVVAVAGGRWLHGMPGIVKVMAVTVWAAGGLQSLGMLAGLLVIGPRKRRRSVYEVTNYRVIVTSGPRSADAGSVYLDQVDEPTVRRHRNGTGDVLLRTGSGGPRSRLSGLFRSGGLGLAAMNPVTRLPAVRDAEQARQVIAEARRRMRDGEIDVFSSPGYLDGPAVPGGITLAPGEGVLWTGRPARIPWWFGGHDVYLTAFMLVWLAIAAGMGVLTAQSGSAVFLVFLVPFALVGGLYPAAGRLVHRRVRIKRSSYVLTSRRLITTWQPPGGRTPVVVQAWLAALLPPSVRGGSVFTGLADADGSAQRSGWRELTWPATTLAPPALIAVPDTQEVAQLIGAAQIATRAPASR